MQRVALGKRCLAEPGPRFFFEQQGNRDPGSAAHRYARTTRCAASGERDHRSGLPPMPDHADRTAVKAVITSLEPHLFVADINVSCDFFVAKLGFAIVFSYGEPPFY